jgi:hypothetical protein
MFAVSMSRASTTSPGEPSAVEKQGQGTRIPCHHGRVPGPT